MTQPAVILVHGATLNGRSWDPVRRLIDLRLQVLAPDLPGHGARRSEPYTLQGGVDTVLAAARSLGDAPFILAGDSLGSYTSQAAAASLPQDRLKGLVLGGASHEFIGAPTLPYIANAMLFRVLIALYGEDKLLARKMPATLREFGMSDEDADNTLAAGMSLKVFPQAVAALRGVDFRSKLAQIAQPTMFINGDADKNHVRGEAHYVAAARQATVHRFAGAEHGVSLRRSREYAALVNAFAQRVLLA
ncbi:MULTISPECIES: alpha/beta fold hydrolase [unclassified Massilia]|uniref:alpha/beta fold hydrolase n=1 Tax=unclassified Massilia TaxID=2609279 RepID=UPI00177F2CD7|nr:MULTISPECIES: alpha/beta hydrolase [unclassified Massilia]MBD8530517.1 alpha/beta hydrolase [Massilia sp. CFBP 13647]MBD8674185.1 alpha/beta hydrolase [Massilia sp. CFBP 13721]